MLNQPKFNSFFFGDNRIWHIHFIYVSKIRIFLHQLPNHHNFTQYNIKHQKNKNHNSNKNRAQSDALIQILSNINTPQIHQMLLKYITIKLTTRNAVYFKRRCILFLRFN